MSASRWTRMTAPPGSVLVSDELVIVHPMAAPSVVCGHIGSVVVTVSRVHFPDVIKVPVDVSAHAR